MPGTGGGLKTRVFFPWWSFIFPSAPSPGDPALPADLGGWRRVYTFSVAVLLGSKTDDVSPLQIHEPALRINLTDFENRRGVTTDDAIPNIHRDHWNRDPLPLPTCCYHWVRTSPLWPSLLNLTLYMDLSVPLTIRITAQTELKCLLRPLQSRRGWSGPTRSYGIFNWIKRGGVKPLIIRYVGKY